MKKTNLTCSECKKKYSQHEIIFFEETPVCINCKDVYIQKIKECVPLTDQKPLRVWWKIYFVILLLISVPSYVFLENRRIWDIIDILIFLPSIVGLAGFCWSKKIRNQKEWKIFFIAYLVWNISYAYIIPLPQSVIDQVGMNISQSIIASISLVPYIPLTIAIYFYSFKKDNLWSLKENLMQ